MKVHEFTRHVADFLIPGEQQVVHWGQLAQFYYQHHVMCARFYLWLSALLMTINLACCAWLLLGGPSVLTIPAVATPLMLITLRVDRKVSLHFLATAEYRLSVSEFKNLNDTEGLPKAISKFKARCAKFDPCST
jgi:hypothetical protein